MTIESIGRANKLVCLSKCSVCWLSLYIFYRPASRPGKVTSSRLELLKSDQVCFRRRHHQTGMLTRPYPRDRDPRPDPRDLNQWDRDRRPENREPRTENREPRTETRPRPKIKFEICMDMVVKFKHDMGNTKKEFWSIRKSTTLLPCATCDWLHGQQSGLVFMY